MGEGAGGKAEGWGRVGDDSEKNVAEKSCTDPGQWGKSIVMNSPLCGLLREGPLLSERHTCTGGGGGRGGEREAAGPALPRGENLKQR